MSRYSISKTIIGFKIEYDSVWVKKVQEIANCDHENDDNTNFCKECGYKLNQTETVWNLYPEFLKFLTSEDCSGIYKDIEDEFEIDANNLRFAGYKIYHDESYDEYYICLFEMGISDNGTVEAYIDFSNLVKQQEELSQKCPEFCKEENFRIFTIFTTS